MAKKRARHAQRCSVDGMANPRGRCTMVYGHVWLGTGWSRGKLRIAAAKRGKAKERP